MWNWNIKLCRRKDNGKSCYFVVLGGREASDNFRATDKLTVVEKVFLLKVVSAYLALAMSVAILFAVPGRKPGGLQEGPVDNNAPGTGAMHEPSAALMTLKEIERVIINRNALSVELGRALKTVSSLLEQCERCEKRENLLELRGALELRVKERFRTLRFEAEKAIRFGNTMRARRTLEEIMSLVVHHDDEPYRYAVRRLKELRR